MRLAPKPWQIVLVLVLAVPAASRADLRDVVASRLAEASVALAPDCTGVLAGGHELVFTAEHCVRGRPFVEATFVDGSTEIGWVAVVDRVSDQALLLLENPVAQAPLPLARRRPIAGQVLYFEGDARAPRFREVTLKRVARVPSLPLLQNALFTTIVGAPSDAGAPIVDSAARVVGLVHGGSRYQVGTPVTAMRRLLDKLLQEGPLPPPSKP
jgi:hypothetical protein